MKTYRWVRSEMVYATSPYSVTRVIRGEHVEEPSKQIHAKRMGTTTALCGRSALSWFKFLDLRFEDVRGDRCPDCLRVLHGPPVAAD